MVRVFNRFDLLNKMTLEETRVDTPKSVSYRHEKPSVLVWMVKAGELELVVHTVGREGLVH